MNMVDRLLHVYSSAIVPLEDEDVEFLEDIKARGEDKPLSEEEVSTICELYDTEIVEAGYEHIFSE